MSCPSFSECWIIKELVDLLFPGVLVGVGREGLDLLESWGKARENIAGPAQETTLVGRWGQAELVLPK
jgi:hypothetical protein